MKRMLTGLKPSGELTLGSFIGGISLTLEYQNQYDSYIFVPDLHAITVFQDPKLLRERIRKNVALYLACGVDPDKNTIYLQSENPYHTNLSWIMECITYMGEAARMTQYKDKSSKGENVSVGLFTYPMLMAADILLYAADIVPTGIDQKQHVELARNLAIRFNNKYGDTFTVPEPLSPKVGAKIMDLQDPTKKMSKSFDNYKGTILLLDSESDIRKKIMSAVTDSEGKIYYDLENKPGISNLIVIYSCLSGISIEEVCERFKSYNYGNFKKEVADIVVNRIMDIQDKYNKIIDSDLVDKVLDEGRKKTMDIASSKILAVYSKMGLGRY